MYFFKVLWVFTVCYRAYLAVLLLYYRGCVSFHAISPRLRWLSHYILGLAWVLSLCSFPTLCLNYPSFFSVLPRSFNILGRCNFYSVYKCLWWHLWNSHLKMLINSHPFKFNQIANEVVYSARAERNSQITHSL